MRYAVIIGVLLVALPLLARINTEEPFADAASYESLRTAQLSQYDSLYSRVYHPTFGDWLYANVQPQLALIVLAAITLLCISLLHDSEAFILLLATTPVFLATFSTVGVGALGLTLIAAAGLLLRKGHYLALLVIPLCFSLSFALGIIASITCIALALMSRLSFLALGASFLSLISGIAAVVIYPERGLGLTIPALSELVGIFGSSTGVTIFLMFLGIIGFLLVWRETKQHSHLLVLLVIPCALFFEHGTILLAVFLAYYASKAWDILAGRRWHFEELQSITLILIVCGVLFSTIVVEKQRYFIDTDRAEVVRFVTSAYPKGTPVFAEGDIAPILAYRGYPARTTPMPENAGFIASTLAEQGFEIIVSKESNPPYAHFPLVYRSDLSGGYLVYSIPVHD